MADTTLDDLNLTQIELLQKYNDALNKFSVINDLIVDGRIAEAENALKLNGLKLYATMNEDGSFNDDGIFKIKEINGQKTLFGILDINMYVKPVTSTLDIFRDGSCVALYEFENNARDTGGVHNAIVTGVTYDNGKIGQAAKFVYSNKFTTDIPCSSNISYSFWIKATRSVSTTDGLYIGWKNSENLNGHHFNMMFGVGQCEDLGCWGWDATYDFSIKNPSNHWAADGLWHHVTVVRTSTTSAIVYIDGVLQTEYYRHSDGTILDHWELVEVPDGKFEINWYSNDNSTVFIDQVRIFNRALTDDEVQILYNEGA